MKKCIVCGREKGLDGFYKHKGMNSGYLNKCKECCKKQAEEREKKLRNNPEWVEKERKRASEKYHRLYSPYKNGKLKPKIKGRGECTKEYRQKYPEKYKAVTKSQRIKEVGLQNHHWSYKEENALDVIFLNEKTHAFIHRNLIYDNKNFCYMTLDKELLDTRDKHVKYIEKLTNNI